MLTFSINRVGDNLAKADHPKRRKADDEFRALSGKQLPTAVQSLPAIPPS